MKNKRKTILKWPKINIPINLGNSLNLQGTAINSVPLILTWQGEKFHMIDVMLFLCLKGLPIF